MEQIFSKLKFITHGEGFIDITCDLNLCVENNNFHSGILNLTSLHTSCSLTINENADPNVLRDLKKYMQSIVPYDSYLTCLLYTSPSPRDATLSRMPSSA